MKKQIILLLVASVIANVDAAAGRFGPAARSALHSGRQVFQSTLPRSVSNIAKQNTNLKASVPQNINVVQPMFVRQLARPTYWEQFRNWFNNLFANKSRTALVTGAAALGGVTTYNLLQNQPAVYAQEKEEPYYDILKKISLERDITTIREQLRQLIGSDHNQQKGNVILLAKKALEGGFKEDLLYLASIYGNEVKDQKKYVSPYRVISNLEDIYGELDPSLEYDQREKKVQQVIQEVASKGNLYAQFLQIHMDYLRGLGSSNLSYLFAKEEISRAGGFFVASRLHSLLKKDPNNNELRYALGLNLLGSGYTGNSNAIKQGLKLMNESGYLKVSVEPNIYSLWDFKQRFKKNHNGLYLKGIDAFVGDDGVIRVPSDYVWNNLQEQFNKSQPIDATRLGLLDEYASQLDEFGKTLKEYNIETERKSDRGIHIYISEGHGSRKGLGQGGLNKNDSEKYIVYDYAKNNPQLNAVTMFLLHAIHHSNDARSVENLIAELKSRATAQTNCKHQ